MLKRILLFAIPVILVTGFAGYYFFSRAQEQYAESSVLKAVPIRTPVFLSINDASRLLTKLDNSSMCALITGLPVFENVRKGIAQFKQIETSNVELAENLKSKQILISLHPDTKEGVTAMVLVDKLTSDEADVITQYFEEAASDASFSMKSRKLNRVTLYEAKPVSGKGAGYAYAYSKGVFMFSKEALLIEDAIHQLDDENFEIDAELAMLLKTKEGKADMNLFINHTYADKMFVGLVSNLLKEKVKLLKTYSGWTGLDLSIRDEKLMVGGFSVNDNADNVYANILRSQTAGISKIETMIPSTSLYFLGMYLSDIKKFSADYLGYLQRQNVSDIRQQAIEKIQNNSGVTADELLVSIFSNEIAMAGFAAEKDVPEGKIFLMKVKSGSSTLEQMNGMQQTYLRITRTPKDGWSKEYQLDKNATYEVRKNPFPGLPEIWFGAMFDKMKANWYTVIGNYLIFSDSYELACKVINSNVLGETLGSEVDFNKFQSALTSKSNISFYAKTDVGIQFADQIFNSSLAKSIMGNNNFRKFSMFGWQVINSGEMVYNNSCLTFSEEIKNKPQTVWQSKLDAPVAIRPQFVVNHTDVQNKDIVVQDVENTLYSISNSGRVSWKLKLDSRLKGEIHQIDAFKNGKLQMLFNTEGKLYLIDKDGNNMNPFPINLRSAASNGVSVFDYDKNRNYRFFVACDDQNIYAYEPDGNLVDGWLPYRTDHPVTQPVQHFRIEGKDFIVASDEMKDYILNRKGEIRVPTNEIYTHSKNNKIYLQEATAKNDARMVGTDDEGNMHFTYFDGTTEVVSLQKFSKEHFFLSANIDRDEGCEYVFADGEKLVVFDHDHNVLLAKNFESRISFIPRIYSFAGSVKKMGIVTSEKGKIYMLNTDGTMHHGFPLDGVSEFSVGFISSDSQVFNLLVGSSDAYIYNYFIQ